MNGRCGVPLTKSASEVEDDRLLDILRMRFCGKDRRQQDEQPYRSCAHCDESNATIPCMDQCGDTYYCSSSCVLMDAKRHRALSLTVRLSLCDEDEDDYADSDAEDWVELFDGVVDHDSDDPSIHQQGDSELDGASCDSLQETASWLIHDGNNYRGKAIQVTCPQCDEHWEVAQKDLTREDPKPNLSTSCKCGEVVGFWI